MSSSQKIEVSGGIVPEKTMEEFRRLSHIFLREHAVGLCHDFIRASYPLAAGSYDKAIEDQVKAVNLAFKSIKARTLANYLYNQDYESAEAYKFKGTSKKINDLIKQKEWVKLTFLFAKMGIQPDGLGRQQVENNANLELLYRWKNQGGRGKKPPIYIRKWKTIDTVRSDKSIYKRVGFMAGGWLMAANDLGNKPDKGTAKSNYIWLNKAGSGGASVVENKNELIYFINNNYANIGGWMGRSQPKDAFDKRKKMLDSIFPSIWNEAIKNVPLSSNQAP